ncbi:nucleolar protein 11 isoform X1 [Ornithorhynchus anatinus]|uniref:Nucleolar protein 11 n=1 Tax=Ornithorhynchus anatinus TaxID=9258 RepID=F7CV68_ORNAN|nr:nucleolar protein 11 isoform X1 [Ornithorhynchus anatinus]
MAALGEDFALCELPGAPAPDILLGVERGREPGHFLLTDSGRTVTVYKVSDQKPLGCWSVRQGQNITCPAVCNFQTGEYVVVHDEKVLRIWKNEDVNLDKAFKATLSANVYRIHSLPNTEPVVLFKGGAVRRLDALLAKPQRRIEAVISDEEVIKWTELLMDAQQQVLIFVTEKHGDYFAYVQTFPPHNLKKYTLLPGDEKSIPLSFTACVQNRNVSLLCLGSSGCVYKVLIPLTKKAPKETETLLWTLLLKSVMPCGSRKGGSLVVLDGNNIAVLGTSAKVAKECLSIWDLKFQTVKTSKELPLGTNGQLWCHGHRLFILHGKFLTVNPFRCEMSSLASVLGKLKSVQAPDPQALSTFVNWRTFQGEGPEFQDSDQSNSPKEETKRVLRTRKNNVTRCKPKPLTAEQLLSDIKGASKKHIEEQLSKFLSNKWTPDFQISIGHLAVGIVSRCKVEPTFYPQKSLVQLVRTQALSYSLCPDLMVVAIGKTDVHLLHLCLQQFPDIPEPVICACLKTFLSISDDCLEGINITTESVSEHPCIESKEKIERQTGIIQNGFDPSSLEEESSDHQLIQTSDSKIEALLTCPITTKRATLLNAILQSAYSETFLLPHLKDLTAQHVILFLQYLHFLYVKCSENVSMTLPGPCPPTLNQIMDWMCLLLDAHFAVIVMLPEAKELLRNLYKFVKDQVWIYSELNKIEGSWKEIQKLSQETNLGFYCIEVHELF